MTNTELATLAETADRVARSAEGRPEAARAAALAERLRAGRFLVSVVGEFKRGKSTLVNALIGEEVAPTGVLPLTAVRTELAYGPASATVEHLDGTRRPIDRTAVSQFVAEELNPANEKKVARVALTGEWDLLAGGVVLVDTPGVGSVYEHNSEEARAALLDTDGAIVVLAADAPVAASERDMLKMLADRRAPTFFVLNKADHIDPEELSRVRRWVEDVIEEHAGRREQVFAVDARRALSFTRAAEDGFDFAELVVELRRFIERDLVGAMVRGARRDLARLGRSMLEALTVEQAAWAMDGAELARLAEQFGQAAEEQRRAFHNDRTLLGRDLSGLVATVRARLERFAADEPPKHFDVLVAAAESVPSARLSEALWDGIQEVVRTSFETFRHHEADRIEQEWQAVAESFRHRTEERVAAVRVAASELFKVDLPRLEIPSVGAGRERFFYLFLRVGSSTDLLSSLGVRLLPSGLVRRRALRKAKSELAREFAKHAGRAGWAMSQRLEEAGRKLEQSMDAQLGATIEAIGEAARRAESRGRVLERERVEREAESARHWELARELADLAEGLDRSDASQ